LDFYEGSPPLVIHGSFNDDLDSRKVDVLNTVEEGIELVGLTGKFAKRIFETNV
jgi:hypothetical protein